MSKSSEMCFEDRFRRVWANLIPDKYDFIVEFCSFLDWWHHTTNARIVSAGTGYGKLEQHAASKQAKVFRADEYFSQVFFEMDELIRDWYCVLEIPAAE